MAGIALPDKLGRLVQANKRWLRPLCAALSGYVMAGCFLFGDVSPFGVALCAALALGDAVPAALGAVVGYLVAWNMPGNIRYIAAVALVCCAKWLLGGRRMDNSRLGVTVGVALISLGISSTAMLAATNATIYDLILSGAELFLAGGAAYFFARALAALPLGWQGASKADLSCIVIAFATVLMGFSGVHIASLSLGRIVAVLVILLCAHNASEAGGAISGITAGLALGLAGGDFAYTVGSYGIGGLAAGLFGHMGRVATAAAFIVVNTVSALLTKDYSAVYTAIFEVFVASIAFIAIPGTVTAKLRLGGANRGNAGGSLDSTMQSSLRDRLGDIAGALKEIGSTTHEVSKKLGEMSDDGPSAICDRVAERVCAGCGMKTACWQFRYNSTMNAMNDCIALLKKSGTINRDQLPKHFVQTCCRSDEFLVEMRAQFQAHVSKQGVQRKVSKVRAVVTDQFEGLALMLDEIASELGAARLLDPKKTSRVREYFEREGFTLTRVLCTVDEFERINVEVCIPSFQAARLHRTRTTLELCSLLEADFEMPQQITRDKQSTFVYTEKANYTVELGAYQLASGANRLCGDAYDYIRNKGGQAHFFLSDGMGSGGSAAVDSAMACALLSRLVSVGIGYEAALKMVNSALLIKSGEESLATIDACTLDLFTGKAQFFKAGAAPTFFLKNGKAGYVESTSLPAGILHGIAFQQSGVTLHEDDVVLMVSDGAVVTGMDWIKSELANAASDCDMQRLCEKIAVAAKMRRSDGHEDDITVLAAALRKGA